MKKLFLLLLLIPMLTMGQSMKELITEYEEFCYQKVPDTIQQTGTVYEKFEPVKGTDYYVAVKDTVWDKTDCRKFKLNSYSIVAWTSSAEYKSSNKLTFSDNSSIEVLTLDSRGIGKPVTRDTICKVPLKRPIPFSDDFADWLKKRPDPNRNRCCSC